MVPPPPVFWYHPGNILRVAEVSGLEYGVVMTEEPEDILGGKPVRLLAAPSGKPTPEMVFAETYVRNGRDGAAAVRKAGLQDTRYSMSYVVRQLLERPDVRAYIEAAEQLEEVSRDVGQYTREYFLHNLHDVNRKALEAGQYASAISATKLQAQLLGMLEQTVNVNHVMTPRDLSLSELRSMVTRALEREGPVIDGEFTESGGE